MMFFWGLIAVAVSSSQAATSAKFWAESNKKEIPSAEGTILYDAQENRVRLDTSKPAALSTLVEIKKKTAILLIHPLHMYVDSDFRRVEGNLPVCFEKGPEACLKKEGFKFSNEENIGTQACGKFLKTTGQNKITVWVPRPYLSSYPAQVKFEGEKGLVILSHFEDFKTVELSQDTFQTPKDYKKAEGLDSFFKGSK